jgi:hypothetical protein
MRRNFLIKWYFSFVAFLSFPVRREVPRSPLLLAFQPPNEVLSVIIRQYVVEFLPRSPAVGDGNHSSCAALAKIQCITDANNFISDRVALVQV